VHGLPNRGFRRQSVCFIAARAMQQHDAVIQADADDGEKPDEARGIEPYPAHYQRQHATGECQGKAQKQNACDTQSFKLHQQDHG